MCTDKLSVYISKNVRWLNEQVKRVLKYDIRDALHKLQGEWGSYQDHSLSKCPCLSYHLYNVKIVNYIILYKLHARNISYYLLIHCK